MPKYMSGSLIVSVNEGADADRIADLIIGNKFLDGWSGGWLPSSPPSPIRSCQPTDDGVRIDIDAISAAPASESSDNMEVGEFACDMMGIDGVSDVQGNLSICFTTWKGHGSYATHCIIDGNRVACEYEG